ncbi:RHS repeat-associated core domain-containing protein, partial [Cronobacter turicensis]|nr:RHS domain-containing protein [Cronobacter turicensis]ELY4352109.1 RHS domain-containing protein [Cronobacter turicensis]ELY6280743.1 RHS domain-containing protein [Cronobacter turicensis]
GVIQQFSYDDEQRIKEIIFTGHAEFKKVQYRYDPLGRRTHKILWRYGEKDPETICFDWQGLQLAGEQSDREPDHYVQYVYTEGSYEPLARVDSVFDDCEIYWYHTELNGLPERVTDADGQTVWRGQFSTWGETERELSVPQWQVPQNLRFQGQYLDRESGLHYNLFRYYDPVAGRYTQMDPIGLAGGMNTYSYVGDPLVWVDSLGLARTPCGPMVRPVNGRRPINSAYAGKIYPASKLPVEIRGKYAHGVPFNHAGFPDFSRYSIKNVRIKLGSSRDVDFGRADRAAGYNSSNPRPRGYTWHHHQDTGYMQLVPTELHDAVRHSGGIATNR